MAETEFFARMQPQFAQHAGSAQEAEERQAHVQRLIAKGEYECNQMRRALSGFVDFAEPATATGEAVPEPVAAAKAA